MFPDVFDSSHDLYNKPLKDRFDARKLLLSGAGLIDFCNLCVVFLEVQYESYLGVQVNNLIR